ncbi:MAG: NUDIX domain-containing protein [Candidatus Nanohaloarchaea archaeon]
MPRRFIVEGASLLERDGEFLLVNRDGLWGFPSAVMEEDEDMPIECARWETMQETSTRVEPEQLVGVYLTPVENRAHDMMSFVYRCSIASGKPGERKGVETGWFTPDEIKELEAPYVVKAVQDTRNGDTGPPDLVQAWRKTEEIRYGE